LQSSPWWPACCVGAHEGEALERYSELLDLAAGEDVRLAEYAREMIAAEVAHQDEVNKMLRRPGQTEEFPG